MNECVVWWGGISGSGYGFFRSYILDGRRVWEAAHRRIWEECFGPIPDELCVLHRCDNPPCVNPEHLFLGTKGVNNRDMFAKGRRGNTTWKRWGKQPPSRQALDEMTSLRADGLSLRAIGRQFGVSHPTVAKLIGEQRGKTPCSQCGSLQGWLSLGKCKQCYDAQRRRNK